METSNTTNYASMTLPQLCEVISKDWKPVHPTAKPYLDAMKACDSINDTYGYDRASDMVMYFLCNAGTWRGAVAREVKKVLNRMAK